MGIKRFTVHTKSMDGFNDTTIVLEKELFDLETALAALQARAEKAEQERDNWRKAAEDVAEWVKDLCDKEDNCHVCREGLKVRVDEILAGKVGGDA